MGPDKRWQRGITLALALSVALIGLAQPVLPAQGQAPDCWIIVDVEAFVTPVVGDSLFFPGLETRVYIALIANDGQQVRVISERTYPHGMQDPVDIPAGDAIAVSGFRLEANELQDAIPGEMMLYVLMLEYDDPSIFGIDISSIISAIATVNMGPVSGFVMDLGIGKAVEWLSGSDKIGEARIMLYRDAAWNAGGPYDLVSPDGMGIRFSIEDTCAANRPVRPVPPMVDMAPPVFDPIPAPQNNNGGNPLNLPNFPVEEVLFVSNRDGQWEIYTMWSTGGGETQLTRNSPGLNYSPNWSPDGSEIVYEGYRNQNWDIYVMNSFGANTRQLTTCSGRDRVPVWSPDGQWIAYGSDCDGNMDIFIMDPQGGNQRRITTDPAVDYYPAWSPDSQYLAFQSTRTGVTQIFTVPIDGSSAPQQITTGDVSKGGPDWSPDGQTIVYYTNFDNNDNRDIYTVPAQGGPTALLVGSAENEAAPSWSTDGEWVYFHVNVGADDTHLMVVRKDGSDLTQLTSGSGRNWNADPY